MVAVVSKPNTVVATAEAFNKASYVNNVAYPSVFDASFIKLREVKLAIHLRILLNFLSKILIFLW